MSGFRLSKELILPEQAITETFAMLGRRGSGKTSTGVVMAEEMLKANHVIIILDPIGVWWGLKEKFPILIAGGEHGDIPLESNSGKLMAEFLVEQRCACILDLSSFGENEMKRFVAEFAQTLYHKNRLAVHLFVDESDEFAPQSGSSGAAKCLGAMQNVVRRGRSHGIGVTLITQRSAVLNKSVLTQTECLFAMQTTAPHDLSAIKDWIKYHESSESAEEILHELPKLQCGEAYVYSPAWLKILKKVKIRPRESFDSSRTPKPGEARQEPKSLKQVDLKLLQGRMAELVQKSKENDPVFLKARIKELESNSGKVSTAARNFAESDQRAVKAAVTERDRHWAGEIRRLTDEVKRRDIQIRKMAKPAEQLSELIKGMVNWIGGNEFIPSKFFEDISHVESKPAKQPIIRALGDSSKLSDDLDGPTRKILNAIGWWDDIGEQNPSVNQVALVAKYKPKGGSFNTYLSRMSSMGLIERENGHIALTQSGMNVCEFREETPTMEKYHAKLIETINEGPLVKILKVLIDASDSMSTEEVAKYAGYEPGGGSFNTYLSRLSSWGLIERKKGQIHPSELLFPRGLK